MSKEKKISKLELDNLREEFKGLPAPSYTAARMFGEIQKKINEIIEKINN